MSSNTLAGLDLSSYQRHRKIHNLNCFIETLKYEVRSGSNWMNVSPADYGYIEGFTGADGDEIDCYIGPNILSDKVFVVNQNRKHSPEKFDEHKCMLGYDSQEDALIDYMAGHTESYKIFKSIIPMTMTKFKHWLSHGDLTRPIGD